MKMIKLVIGLVAIFLLMSNFAFSQTKCLLIVTNTSFSAEDKIIYDKLKAWEYDVTAIPSSDISFLISDDITPHNFIFVSESIGSGDLAKGITKSIPLPMVNLEGWAVKPGGLNWQKDRNVNNYPPVPVKIVDNTNHPLAAGFEKDATVTIVTDVTNGLIIGSVPQIPIIPIAVMSSNEAQQVIYGIEAGTINAVGDTIHSRIATIGIHMAGYPSMTEDAWKFIKAGIDWVMTKPSGVAEKSVRPARFELAQNFPNPFNPTTEIAFSISEKMNVKLEIYNTSGQFVGTVMNGELAAGSYSFPFIARNLPSGVYYYKLQAGDEIQTRKMVLMK